VRATCGPRECPHCQVAYIWKAKHRKLILTTLVVALIIMALTPIAPSHVAESILLLGNITVAGIGIYALTDGELRPAPSPDRSV